MSDSDEQMDWDGYTDYKRVAGNIAVEVQSATAAAARIQRANVERAGAEYDATEASQTILSAAKMLYPQLQHYQDANDDYREIVESWAGDDGMFARMRQTSFERECPEWLGEFVDEINEAALLLGYLKAGREEAIDDDSDDDVESEVRQVIEEMTV